MTVQFFVAGIAADRLFMCCSFLRSLHHKGKAINGGSQDPYPKGPSTQTEGMDPKPKL